MSKLWSFFICHGNQDLEADADSSSIRSTLERCQSNAASPVLVIHQCNHNAVLVTVFSWFISEPASSIFSYTKSAPATNQPTIFLFHHSLATSHSQSNRASDFGTHVSLLSI